MARFEIPEKMQVWTIWALWWLLIGAACMWVLVGSVGYFVERQWLPADTAGWVQAFGSIGAIVAAGIIPLWHAYKHEQRDKERMRSVIRLLAEDHHLAFRLFDRALRAAVDDFGESLNRYEEKGYPMMWGTLLEGLTSLDVTRLDALEFRAVTDMKKTTRYALDLVALLGEWDWTSDAWRDRHRLVSKYALQAILIEIQMQRKRDT